LEELVKIGSLLALKELPHSVSKKYRLLSQDEAQLKGLDTELLVRVMGRISYKR